MTPLRVELLPEAIQEVQDAFDWYQEQSPKVAGEFLLEVDLSIRKVCLYPQMWAKFVRGTRRYILRKFPYSLIYRESKERIQVIAFAHHKRNPQYWAARLNP